MGLVYQAFVNYPNWNVFRNIASPLLARGTERAAVEQKVVELATRLQIEALLERQPHELSGGQQQRVAIARALAQGGRVLVMDEPPVNLDYKLREELESQLRELLLDEDPVVIYTTSDPRDAFILADEVVLLDERDKIQSGTPLEVYREPVSVRAADLMSNPGLNRLATGEAVRPEHLSVTRRSAGDFVATRCWRCPGGLVWHLIRVVGNEDAWAFNSVRISPGSGSEAAVFVRWWSGRT